MKKLLGVIFLIFATLFLIGASADGQQGVKTSGPKASPKVIEGLKHRITLPPQVAEEERQACRSLGGCYFDCRYGDVNVGCRDSAGNDLFGKCIEDSGRIDILYRVPASCTFARAIYNTYTVAEERESRTSVCLKNTLKCQDGGFLLEGETQYGRDECQDIKETHDYEVAFIQSPLSAPRHDICEWVCGRKNGCWAEGGNTCVPRSTWKVTHRWAKNYYGEYKRACREAGRGVDDCEEGTTVCAFCCSDQYGLVIEEGDGCGDVHVAYPCGEDSIHLGDISNSRR